MKTPQALSLTLHAINGCFIYNKLETSQPKKHARPIFIFLHLSAIPGRWVPTLQTWDLTGWSHVLSTFWGGWYLWYQVSSRRVGMSRRWVPTHQTWDLRGWPHVLSGGLVSLVPGLGGWVGMWVPTPRHGTSGPQVLSGGWYLCYQGPWGGCPNMGPSRTWDTVGKRAVRILLECFLVSINSNSLNLAAHDMLTHKTSELKYCPS